MIRIAELPGEFEPRSLLRDPAAGKSAGVPSTGRHAAGRFAPTTVSGAKILSVSGLNREARRIVETGLGTVWVEGKISNLSRPSSGHLIGR